MTCVDTSKLTNLKLNAVILDTDKLKNIPTNLCNLKNKVDKIDADKLVPIFVDLVINLWMFTITKFLR